jgi:hypothetical protein
MGSILSQIKPKTINRYIQRGISPVRALKSRREDLWVRSQDNKVYKWSDMSICGILFQFVNYKNQTNNVDVVQSKHHHRLFD